MIKIKISDGCVDRETKEIIYFATTCDIPRGHKENYDAASGNGVSQMEALGVLIKFLIDNKEITDIELEFEE